MFRSVRRFCARPRWQKYMLWEAYVLLFLCRMAVLALPFKKIMTWSDTKGLLQLEDSEQNPTIHWIQWSVTTASRYGWWNCMCLTQALAAKCMLKRRGCAGTLHLGATPPSQGKMKAHAWLRCGDTIVTGEKGYEKFAEMASFP